MLHGSSGALFVFACVLLLTAVPVAGAFELIEEEDVATIEWHDDLSRAFEKAAGEKKIVMVCINARLTQDGREESAAKGLREVIYRDPAVVEKSRQFVCVLLTTEGSSADYGEIRARFGISGSIVSPQHIFASPNHREGGAPLVRKKYWSYGKGEAAVTALLALMDKALAAHAVEQGLPPPEEGKTPDAGQPDMAPPESGRATWIQETLALTRAIKREIRRAALRALIRHDEDGDCLDPVLALIPEFAKAKKMGPLADVVHELGVPGLERALPALHDMLKHKDESVRANAAISLEYVGSKESVSVLTKRVNREKSEAIANHMYRALGRCGAGESKVKRLLLRHVQGGKSRFSNYGPIIGLAYFEGDAKLARLVEKQLLKFGQPFGGRGGGGTFMRAILVWCLSEIADPDTAPFMRERYITPLEKVESRYVDDVAAYYKAVAKKCEGGKSEDVQAAITAGICWYLRWGRSARELRDEARRDRDTNTWEPKGEWERPEDD